MSAARDEAERRVREDEGLHYDMEVDAFINGWDAHAERAYAETPERVEVMARAMHDELEDERLWEERSSEHRANYKRAALAALRSMDGES